MDVDPNYDPSDFLKMPSRNRDETSQASISDTPKFDYSAINIKQEPQTHHQSYDDQHYDQSSFDMSEMLQYRQPNEAEYQQAAEQQAANEQAQMHVPEEPEPQQPQPPLDDVGIHDDLAISDSSDDDNDFVEPKSENPPNDNEDDGDGLWF